MIEVQLKGLPPGLDEATIQSWRYEEGDGVSEGADLVELTAEETSFTIQVPVSGVLAEVYFDEGESVQRDEVICVIDEKESDLEDETEP